MKTGSTRRPGHVLAALLALMPGMAASAQDTRFVQLAGAAETTYALREDGSVVGWGRNDKGQLGPNPSPGLVPHKARPTVIALPGRAREIAAGGDNGYALLEDGRVLAWGEGLGLGTGGGSGAVAAPADSATPVEVPLTGVRHIHAYKDLAIALMQDGSLRAWGSRSGGRVGDGLAVKRWGESSPPALAPVVVPGAQDIVQVSIGDKHVLALRKDGRVLSWGLNARGQLGRHPVQEQALDTPGLVEGVSDAVLVAAGDFPVSMAVRRDGTLLVWGSRGMAQFGSGQADNGRGEWTVDPVPVPGVRHPVQVVVGNLNVIARFADGALMGWGNTDWGNLGIGKKTGFVYSPTRLALRDVKDVAVQFGRTYAIKRDGSLWYMGVGDKTDWQSSQTSNAAPIPLRF